MECSLQAEDCTREYDIQTQKHLSPFHSTEQIPQEVHPHSLSIPHTDSLGCIPPLSHFSIQQVADVFKSQNAEDIMEAVPEVSIIGEHCKWGLVEFVLPAIMENCSQYAPSLQVTLGTELLKIDMDEIPPSIGKHFCASAILIIDQNRKRNWTNTRNQEIYGELLCRVVQLVEWASDESIDLLIYFDHNIGSSASHLRQMAFKLLSAVALSYIEEGLLNKHILPRMWNALPDVEPVVTGEGIKYLAKLPSRLSSNAINKRLWNEIARIWKTNTKGSIRGKEKALEGAAELANSWYPGVTFDKNVLEAFYKYLSFWTMECCRKKKKIAEEGERELLCTTANAMGPLSRLIPRKSRRLCKNAFRDLCLCTDKTIRENCAKSLPLVSENLEKSHQRTMMRIVQRLTEDDTKEVKIAVAEGFHLSVKHILRSWNARSLLQNMRSLLTDEDPNVQFKAMVNISETLGTIFEHRKCITVFSRLAREILSVSSQVPQTWRQRNQAVEQLGLSAKFIPAPFLEREVIPYLTRLFMKDISSVRKEAGKAVIRALQHLGGADRWKEAAVRFCNTVHSGSANRRVGLVDVLLFAVEEFSSHSFHAIFAPELYKLADDDVSNVRLKLASNIHIMASPCLGDLRFAIVISKLSMDHDINVREEMRLFVERASEAITEARQNVREDVDKHRLELMARKHSPALQEDDTTNCPQRRQCIKLCCFN